VILPWCARSIVAVSETGGVTIIPRWEWRVFGDGFETAEAVFAELTPGPVEETEELYLVSPADVTVKVRFGLMDVKVLREVDADGLERWEPVLKLPAPLSAADVAAVLDALGVVPPPATRDSYTLDEFVAEFGTGDVRAVEVRKRRVRYAIGGCKAEMTEVTAAGRPTRTIAVESEDAAAVIAAVRRLGLDAVANTSYPRALAALAALADAGPQRCAVIDVGTNSVKFHVGEREADGTWRAVADRAEMTRLGEGLDRLGVISAEPLERTVAAIAGMVEEAERLGARAIAAVGTAGLRIAGNSADAVATIRERTGVTVEVIPGEEEGRLAYLAVLSGLGTTTGSLVVFDTGGGSSQFTFGTGAHVDEQFSVNVGAVRFTERFGLAGVVAPDVLREAMAAISADLSRIDGRPPPDALVAMGGAVTNLTAVKLGLATYDPDAVQGAVLDRAEIDRQIELYRSRDADARREIVGLQPKRAEVILAGACVVRTVMEKLGQESLTVSDRGLRHGLLVERFGT
jgi:exopolyphosphatase/guanosine-5'-triphosphate,3'-diphosphate pyrophosphatase